MALVLLLAATAGDAAAALPPASVATVGDMRVQTLSPTLVRVEQRGAHGFEDRPTFMAVGREQFAGVPISAKKKLPSGATQLSTCSCCRSFHERHATSAGTGASCFRTSV